MQKLCNLFGWREKVIKRLHWITGGRSRGSKKRLRNFSMVPKRFSSSDEFKSSEDLKERMIIHSYSYPKLQFKCDECNFWGPNKQRMKMHVKRNYSEIISCGMCNFEANQVETLDTHTFTCEMYKCNECKITFLHLDRLKTHMKNEHHGCGCLSHGMVCVNLSWRWLG